MIGTLSEKSIHRILKDYIEPNREYQEIKVGNYIADIKRDNQIIEVQTKDFKKLISKIDFYLKAGYNLKVVYPVIIERYINWIEPSTGEIIERKKSPIKGSIQDSLLEVYWIKEYLDNKQFKFSIITLNAEEYKLLDGYGHNNKKKATKVDKVPTQVIDEITFNNVNDLSKLIPKELGEEFTSREFVKQSKSKKKWAGSYVKLLRELGVITVVRKSGNTYIYKKVEGDNNV